MTQEKHQPRIYSLGTTETGHLQVYTCTGPDVRWLMLKPPCNPMAPGETYPEQTPWTRISAHGRDIDFKPVVETLETKTAGGVTDYRRVQA